MAQEKYLAKTKDNHVLVFTIDYSKPAEKSRKETECRNACANVTYNEFIDDKNAHISDHIPAYDAFDVANTEFILDETLGYHYYKNRAAYENRLLTEPYPAAANQPDVLHFDSRIGDDLVPEMIKNIGFKIVPVDEVYDVTYNHSDNSYEIRDPAGGEFKQRVATVLHSENKMEVVRNHFKFSHDDYERLTQLLNDFERQRQSNPRLSLQSFINSLGNGRSKALMQVYKTAYFPQPEKESMLLHELKHVKNAIFYAGLELKNDARRLSIEDLYRLKVEDERSAYFNEWLDGINKYLQKGDFSDYSMFGNSAGTIVNKLKSLRTDGEKQAYVTDYRKVMSDFVDWFNANKQGYYEAQFNRNVTVATARLPLSAEPDSDRREYKRLRSLFYRYEVYNPQTRRMEYKDLSSFMADVCVNAQARSNIIQPNEEVLRQRMERYNEGVNNGSINPALFEAAKKIMRENIAGSAFVNQVDDLQIATLYHENEAPAPSEPQVPDDRAGWSDELKNYWSGVDGYQEIAKNNNEYKFKIHDATLSYENTKRVHVSSNAPYDLYVKLLHEPTNANKPVEFLDSLTHEQALTLYVACINSGRQVRGHVPTDLSGIENIQGIPPAALNRFRHVMASRSSGTAKTTEPVNQKRTYIPPRTILSARHGR